MKARDLPPEWAKEFADPDVMVIVALRSPPNGTEERHAANTVEQTFEQISLFQRDDILLNREPQKIAPGRPPCT